jgi:hypothetical protein
MRRENENCSFNEGILKIAENNKENAPCIGRFLDYRLFLSMSAIKNEPIKAIRLANMYSYY